MNNAIIAVTKSAYATFHAPPWWPPWPAVFLMTTMGAWAMANYAAAGAAGAAAAALLRQVWSISGKLGRTWLGTARRPMSTAISGGMPLLNAVMATRSIR